MGVGIDLVEINRFKDLPYEKNKSFFEKNFSKNEIEYCLKFSDSYRHFAGKFALKEALIKSVEFKISFLEIKTFHVNSKPKIEIQKFKENYNFLVSLSHEKSFAIAIVLSEKII